MNRIRFATSLSALFGVLAVAHTAAADPSGFAVNRFEPSERGSDWFTTESLDLRGARRGAAGVVTEYNRDALEVRHSDGRAPNAIMSDQLTLHLGGDVVLADRFRLGADLPVASYADGSDATANGQAYARPSTTALGDLRLVGDVRIFGEYGDKLTVAAGLQLFLPTGSRAAYTSDGAMRITPRVLAAGKLGIFEYAARVGVAFRRVDERVDSTSIGSELSFAGSAGVRVHDRLLIGPEIFGGAGAADAGARMDGVEILGGAHGKVSDALRVSLGAGGGLTQGFGTPSFRTMLSLEWAPAAVKQGAPPPPSRDDAPPPARDVSAETTPMIFAPVAQAAQPVPDRDDDGIADDDDACPTQAGPRSATAQENGCPAVVLRNSRIEVVDRVKFRTGSAELDPASDPILEAIRDVLLAHPDVSRIRIEGHTDNEGNPSSNQALSSARAEAVASWLRSHGLDAARVTSAGLGDTQPISSNSTEAGRRDNRRVEFHVEAEPRAEAHAER